MQTLPTPESPPTFHDKHLHVDLNQQAVMLDGETVRLTPMQYRLLALLVEHAGVVVSRPILLMQIWRCAPEIHQHKVDTCIRGLRKKLGVCADHYIETVIGVGYRFRPLVPASD
jgi:DNA-binding response OmpR family regulator